MRDELDCFAPRVLLIDQPNQNKKKSESQLTVGKNCSLFSKRCLCKYKRVGVQIRIDRTSTTSSVARVWHIEMLFGCRDATVKFSLFELVSMTREQSKAPMILLF